MMFNSKYMYVKRIIVRDEELLVLYHNIQTHPAEDHLTILCSGLKPITGSSLIAERYNSEEEFSVVPVPSSFNGYRVPFKESRDSNGTLLGYYIAVPYSKFISQFHSVPPIETQLRKLHDYNEENQMEMGAMPTRELSVYLATLVGKILELFMAKESFYRTVRWNKLKPLFANPLRTNTGPALESIPRLVSFRTTDNAYSIRIGRQFFWEYVMNESQRNIYRDLRNMGPEENPSQSNFPVISYRTSDCRNYIILAYTHRPDARASSFSTITIPCKPPENHLRRDILVPFRIFDGIGLVLPNLARKNVDQNKALREFKAGTNEETLHSVTAFLSKGRRTPVGMISTRLTWEDYSYQKRNELGEDEEFDPLDTISSWALEASPIVAELPFRNWNDFLNIMECDDELSLEEAREENHYLVPYFLSIYGAAATRKKSKLNANFNDMEDID